MNNGGLRRDIFFMLAPTALAVSQWPWLDISTRAGAAIIMLAGVLSAIIGISRIVRPRVAGLRTWLAAVSKLPTWMGLVDRKQHATDALLLMLQDHVPGLMTFRADAKGNWIACSEPLELFLGVGFEQLREFNWQEQVDLEERDSIEKRWAVRTQKGLHFDCDVPWKNGKWTQVIAIPVKDDRGEVVVYGGQVKVSSSLLAADANGMINTTTKSAIDQTVARAIVNTEIP